MLHVTCKIKKGQKISRFWSQNKKSVSWIARLGNRVISLRLGFFYSMNYGYYYVFHALSFERTHSVGASVFFEEEFFSKKQSTRLIKNHEILRSGPKFRLVWEFLFPWIIIFLMHCFMLFLLSKVTTLAQAFFPEKSDFSKEN